MIVEASTIEVDDFATLRRARFEHGCLGAAGLPRARLFAPWAAVYRGVRGHGAANAGAQTDSVTASPNLPPVHRRRRNRRGHRLDRAAGDPCLALAGATGRG